jgi:hypothetical protein
MVIFITLYLRTEKELVVGLKKMEIFKLKFVVEIREFQNDITRIEQNKKQHKEKNTNYYYYYYYHYYYYYCSLENHGLIFSLLFEAIFIQT